MLSKGHDLQHATACIVIANNLHSAGAALDLQIVDARHTAAAYATTTNALLARPCDVQIRSKSGVAIRFCFADDE